MLDAGPGVLNHDIETVAAPHGSAGGRYERALRCPLRGSRPRFPGDRFDGRAGRGVDEVVATLRDVRAAGVDIVTIGQYLRPSAANLPMVRYYTPQEFAELKEIGRQIGFGHVESGPLVRSSYHAHEQTEAFEQSKQ